MNLKIDPTINSSNTYDELNTKMFNYNYSTLIIIISIVIVVLYIMVFSNLGNSTSSSPNVSNPFGSLVTPPSEFNASSISSAVSSPSSSSFLSGGFKFLEMLMWAVLILLILINALQYLYGFNIATTLSSIVSGKPHVDVKLSPEQELELRKKTLEETEPAEEVTNKEVFHIKDNIYTYDQAKMVCKAFDSELATYDQVREAYNNGGEWCGYGWSEDQMGLFPTQKKTWEKLQKIEGHEHDCGRPGINGGYFSNKNMKFGVNCYGVKRSPNKMEMELMKARKEKPFPVSDKEKKLNKLVNEYKKKINSIGLNPFSKKTWSEV